MKKKWLLTGSVILLLASASILVCYFVDENDNDSQSEWFIFADGKETDIYVNSTTYYKSQGWNSDIDVMQISPLNSDPHTEEEKKTIINKLIGENYSIRIVDGNIVYKNNTKVVSNRVDGFFSYADSSAISELKYNELLSENELINRTKEILQLFKVNRSELKLDIIESKEKIKTIYGSNVPRSFGEQIVTYIQYINGNRVDRYKGDVFFAFGKNGELILFQDNTLKYNNIQISNEKMPTFNETVVMLSNVKIGLKSDKWEITSFEVVLYVPERVVKGSTTIVTSYRFEFTPIYDPETGIVGESVIFYYRTCDSYMYPHI
ncbi:MAG: hypothetical protein JXA22_01615 [Candidatus Thermoplasmatota archaeon]|nr:hypothetical protein [Candidatus Thermoplasmatota archaeon]